MIARSAALYFLYSSSSAAIGFISIAFLTRFLTPEEYAYLGVFGALIYVVLPLISLRAEGLIGINFIAMPKSDYVDFRNAYVSTAFCFYGVTFPLAACAAYFFARDYAWLIVMTFAIALIRYLSNIHSYELVQQRRANAYGAINLGNSLLALLGTLILIPMHPAWDSRLIAILGAELLVAAGRIFLLSDFAITFKFRWDPVAVKAILRFGAPLYIALALAWIISESDKFIVLGFFTKAELGLYTVAYGIGAFLDRINQATYNAVVPVLYKALSESAGRKLLIVYNIWYSVFALTLACIASLGFIMFSDTLLGEAYQKNGSLTAIVLFAFAFSGIYRTSGVVIDFFKLNALKTKIMFYGAMANLILSIGLIPRFGLLAPAIGTLASYLVLAVLSYIYSRQELGRRNIGV